MRRLIPACAVLLGGCAIIPVGASGPSWQGTVDRDGELVEFIGYPTYPGSQGSFQPDGFGVLRTRDGAVVAHIDVTPPPMWEFEDGEYLVGQLGNDYASVQWIEEDRDGTVVFTHDAFSEDTRVEGTLEADVVDGSPNLAWHGTLDVEIESELGVRRLEIEFDAADAVP